MSGKLRDQKNSFEKVKLEGRQEPKHLTFSFEYLTDNKDYCFDYFGKDIRKAKDAYDKLIFKLKQLCKMSLAETYDSGKKSGCERIPYKVLSGSVQKICDNTNIISKSARLTVFRFCEGEYRAICSTDINDDSLLYLIAFDFSFSAYKH